MTSPMLAKVFDVTDPVTGPRFTPDHPRIPLGPQRDRVLAYLEAGTGLLLTPGMLRDRVEPARGRVVPAGFRTDGVWIWTDAVSYYLRGYGLAPQRELLRHILAAGGQPPVPDARILRRAMTVITAPS